MHRGSAFAAFAVVLSLGFATGARAQSSDDSPAPWETGDTASPPQSSTTAPAADEDETLPAVEYDGGSEDAAGGQSPVDARAHAGLVMGAKVGAGLGKPISDFGATPVFELELGYMPNLGASLGHSLEIFALGQYAQPGLDGAASEVDPRLLDGQKFSYDVTQRMLSLSLGALFRFDVGNGALTPYGGLGGRMYLLKTDSKASVGGEPLGRSTETLNAFGLVVLGGLDVYAGPGALLAELSFGWAALDGYIMRNTNVGALNLALGYRVML